MDSTSGWKSSLGKIYKQNSARAIACEAQTHFRSSLLSRSDDRKCVCASQATRARTSTLNSARVTAHRRQTLSTRDRGYTATTNTVCKELATKYYSYTAKEADEEREHRLPTFQYSVNSIRKERQVYSQNYHLRCNERKQELHHL